MSEIHEITTYKYYTFSSRDASIANTVILLYGNNGSSLGSVFFSNNDEASLQPAKKNSNGYFILYYHNADLPVIVDMIRNEKPVYLIYNGEINTRISTSSEPVGEGEV